MGDTKREYGLQCRQAERVLAPTIPAGTLHSKGARICWTGELLRATETCDIAHRDDSMTSLPGEQSGAQALEETV